jgi:lipopolysaccharide transport system permease protein
VEGFRWALLSTGAFPTQAVLIASGISLVLLISGLYYFKRMERTFADMV